METPLTLTREIEPSKTSNAMQLKFSLRDVIYLLVLLGGLALSYGSQSAKIDALKDAVADVKQDIRELRHSIDKHP